MQAHTHLLTHTYKGTQWRVRTLRHTWSYARPRTAEHDVLLMHSRDAPLSKNGQITDFYVFLQKQSCSHGTFGPICVCIMDAN